MRTPLPLRKLKADMILKDLSLEAVAKQAKINYSVASALLLGSRINARQLDRLKRVIEKAPIPEEVAA